MRLMLLAGTAAAGLVLAACSSSGGTPAESASTPVASPSPSGTSQVLPPIEIDGQKAVTVKVGDTLNVITKKVKKVSTDDATVLRVSQPRVEGQARFNGGAVVVMPGTATLVVAGKKGELYSTAVTATE